MNRESPLGVAVPPAHTLISMTRRKYGSATQAAKIMDRSKSQFNVVRDAGTLVYDPVTQATSPMPAREEMIAIYLDEVGPLPPPPKEVKGERRRRDPVVEHFVSTRYLVCPALYGRKLPRSQWEYDLATLQKMQESGPPGVWRTPPQ